MEEDGNAFPGSCYIQSHVLQVLYDILILQYLLTHSTSLERNWRNQIKILNLPLLERKLHPALQYIRPQLKKSNSVKYEEITKTIFKFSSISKVTSLEKEAAMKNGHTQTGVCQHRQIWRLNEAFHSFSDKRDHIIREI